MDCVLFSPIGTTDPICDQRDGAMLHICRIYKPKKVYLYLSGEMVNYHKQDNRYCDALERLGNLLSHPFEVHCILRPDLFDVHLFDGFYIDFETEIEKIKKENPEDTVLLNVSSGTPAMKSSLQLLAALSDGTCRPIQVASPNKRSNPRRDDITKYDNDLYWELNADNTDAFVNRSSVSGYLNLMERIKTEIIKRHIDVYDYFAALTVAQSLKQLPAPALELLELACHRLMLKHSEVDKLRGRFPSWLIPVVNSQTRKIVEYMLWLDVKLKRKEYLDFVRGLTPIILAIFDMYVSQSLGLAMENYCQKRGKVLYLTRDGLSKTEEGQNILAVLDAYFAPYRDGFYASAPLTAIINAYAKEPNVVDRVNLLRQVEESVRNIAAHEIVYVDDDFIRRQCGHTPREIFDALKYLIHTVIPMPKDAWESYNEMNRLLKTYLQPQQA